MYSCARQYIDMFNGNYNQVQRNVRKSKPRSARLGRVHNEMASPRCLSSLRQGSGRRPLRLSPKMPSGSAVEVSPNDAVTSEFHPMADMANLVRPPSESDSILSLYVREAAEVRLLTPAEEVELAARIRTGDEAAREQMIRANLRFVVKIAREYEHLGMPLLDLINEGNIGLMRAVEKFDPAKGAKFSSYASLWIKQQIRRALASQGKTIRLPIHVADKIYQLGQAEVRLRNMLGRDATDEELAHELGVKAGKLSRLRRAAMRPASLDAPLGEDHSTVADVVADENAATPYDELLGKTETRLIHKLVEKLPEREATIIRFRFGLDGSRERTLQEVGRKLNLTRERIRQLQNLAFMKLRRMLEEPGDLAVAA